MKHFYDSFGLGDAAIMDYVLDKYKPLVRKKANAMFLIGGDTDDLYPGRDDWPV